MVGLWFMYVARQEEGARRLPDLAGEEGKAWFACGMLKVPGWKDGWKNRLEEMDGNTGRRSMYRSEPGWPTVLGAWSASSLQGELADSEPSGEGKECCYDIAPSHTHPTLHTPPHPPVGLWACWRTTAHFFCLNAAAGLGSPWPLSKHLHSSHNPPLPLPTLCSFRTSA